LRKIIKEVVYLSEAIKKVIKLSKFSLKSTSYYIRNYLIKIWAINLYIEQVAAIVAARTIIEVGDYKSILDNYLMH